jgi:hypothetical protein
MAAVGFIVLALPQIVILYRATGTVRLEGKSAINFAIGSRLLAGQDLMEAEYAVSEGLKKDGVWMSTQPEIIAATNPTIGGLARFVGIAVRQNTPTILRRLSEPWVGAPFLLALASVGFFRHSWQRSNASRQLFVFLVPVIAIAATYSIFHTSPPRYHFVVVPFMAIWAAHGAMAMGAWVRATVDILQVERLKPIVLSGTAVAMAMVAFLSYVHIAAVVRRDSRLDEESASNRDVKEVGLWIKQQQSGRVKVMDVGTPLAFHANADYVHFPYSDSETAIRFIEAESVDYLVLRREATFTRYYDDWVASGIPDDRAILVHSSNGPQPGRLVVYRWKGMADSSFGAASRGEKLD